MPLDLPLPVMSIHLFVSIYLFVQNFYLNKACKLQTGGSFCLYIVLLIVFYVGNCEFLIPWFPFKEI